jgi:hypothetical protein
MPSGFVDRYKGKIYQATGSLQQVGSGGAVTLGGGQINSTSAASTSGGIASSGVTTVSTVTSQTIPPKTLDRFGRNLLINAWGTFSTANAGAKTAAVMFGLSTGMIVVNSTTITTLQGWFASVSVTCNSTDALAAKQTIWGQGAGSSVHGGCQVSTGTENMLLASTVKILAQSSVGTAGDVIVLGMQFEGLN